MRAGFFRKACLLPLAIGLLAGPLGGCDLEERSDGARGRLQFSFSQFDGCLFGCLVSHEVLAGAEAEVRVDGLDPNGGYTVRTNAPALATTARPSLCDTRTCLHLVLDTKAAGDVSLEVVDATTDAVVDFAVIKIRDAVRVETQVKTGLGATIPPVPSGTFEVKQGTEIDLVNVARSAEGIELHLSSRGFQVAYSDESILGPREKVFGASRTENAIAKRPGEGKVTIRAGSGLRELGFRVVP